MELPPYHLPTFRGIMYHTLSRLKSFLTRAGRVIVAVVVVLSFLGSLGTDGSFGNGDSADSVLSKIGMAATPIFHPMGITDENWPATVGLFTGIFAKEAVVGTLNNLYTGMVETAEIQEESFSLAEGLRKAFTAIPSGFSGMNSSENTAEPPGGNEKALDVMRSRFNGTAGAYAYILFILIYSPCVAVIAAIYKETTLGWAVFSTAYLTILAWVVSTLFYRFATFGTSPGESLLWIGVAAAILGGMWYALKVISGSGRLKA